MFPKLFLHGTSLAAAAGLAWSVQGLPARVAIHFNLAGQPDSWASRSTYLLFGIVTIALMWLLFVGLPKLIEKSPAESINIPNKEHWLAPEHIDEFRAIFTNYMYFYGGVTQLFLIGVGIIAHMAQTQHTQLSTSRILILLGVFVATTFGWIIALVRRLQR